MLGKVLMFPARTGKTTIKIGGVQSLSPLLTYKYGDMKKAQVKLSFRQFIDNTAKSSFEKDVFSDSYDEFLLQSQAYNTAGSFNSFSEMVNANPKANSLHYKTGFAVGLYIQQLNKIIPGLTDSQSRAITFSSHRFEIVTSELNNKQAHVVSITYYTNDFILLEMIGNNLLLAPVTKSEFGSNETFLVALQNNLSVCSYEELEIEAFS